MPEPRKSIENTTAEADLANEVWSLMTSIVADSRDDWRRQAVSLTGLPFSRLRVLRRIARRPLTITEIADATTMDAPAASVAVSQLEEAGYVLRESSPTDRRCKQVHLTDAGHEVIARFKTISDPAPDRLRAAAPDQLAVMRDVLRGLTPGLLDSSDSDVG